MRYASERLNAADRAAASREADLNRQAEKGEFIAERDPKSAAPKHARRKP